MPSHGSHRRIVDDGTGTRERWGKRLREEWGERTMIIPPLQRESSNGKTL